MRSMTVGERRIFAEQMARQSRKVARNFSCMKLAVAIMCILLAPLCLAGLLFCPADVWKKLNDSLA